MKQELITQLVKELFDSVEELHNEYKDNDIQYVIDATKEGNTLSIEITLETDKKEFEQWIDQLDDDIFTETWETLSEEDNLHDLNELYNSENYHEVIDKFKSKAKEIIEDKIEYLHKILSDYED